MLQSASLGARYSSKKVMLLLTDGQVTDQYEHNYLPAIERLKRTDILRFGNFSRSATALLTINADWRYARAF